MGARSILAFHYSSCDRFAAGDLVRSADRPRIHLAVQAIAGFAALHEGTIRNACHKQKSRARQPACVIGHRGRVSARMVAFCC